jgi:hypothetical protein
VGPRWSAHGCSPGDSVLMRVRRVVLLTLLGLSVGAYADDSPTLSFASTYGDLVDGDGSITLPENFQTQWVFLGTWSVAKKDVERSSEASGHGAAGLHNVYTQPGVVEYYLQHKSFPDGAVLIKELLKGVTAPMTTGTVSRAGEPEGWFMMVKDSQGRVKDKPHWGDGWGWALFNVGQLSQPVTKNYKTECIGCHIPAQKNDWVYIEGYPLLQSQPEK